MTNDERNKKLGSLTKWAIGLLNIPLAGSLLDLWKMVRTALREKIKLLLEHQSPVNAPGTKGRTALHYAAAAGFLEVMTILLEQGADYRIRDQQGETPLALARRYNRIAAANLLAGRGAVE